MGFLIDLLQSHPCKIQIFCLSDFKLKTLVDENLVPLEAELSLVSSLADKGIEKGVEIIVGVILRSHDPTHPLNFLSS